MTSSLRRLASRVGLALAVASAWVCAPLPARAAPAATVQLEELTWTELRQRIAAGTGTVLLPLGGTEQNGPHMALGKHNVRVRVLAERIARELGNAVVAPVVAYVPEGSIDPPGGHMRWPGSISVPDPVFEGLLDAAARSLQHAGFCHVVLLADSGGYRGSMDRVAARLNRARPAPRGRPACGVHTLPEYYRAATAGHAALLQQRGIGSAEIGTHAGLADTALLLAVAPELVRTDAAGRVSPAGLAPMPAGSSSGPGSGVSGDPARASAELGRIGIEHIIAVSVAAIRALAPPDKTP